MGVFAEAVQSGTAYPGGGYLRHLPLPLLLCFLHTPTLLSLLFPSKLLLRTLSHAHFTHIVWPALLCRNTLCSRKTPWEGLREEGEGVISGGCLHCPCDTIVCVPTLPCHCHFC